VTNGRARIPAADRLKHLSVSIRDFEQECEPLLARICATVNDVLDQMVSKVQDERQLEIGRLDFDEVILVGAATRMPMLRRRLETLLEGKSLDTRSDADRTVAIGAAVKAAIVAEHVSSMH
jgi:molecular chaperone DnaK (HSP70)